MRHDLFAPDASRPWRPRGQLAPAAGASSTTAGSPRDNSPDWSQLRAAMMTALQPYPEARESLIRVLRSLQALQEDQ